MIINDLSTFFLMRSKTNVGKSKDFCGNLEPSK